MVHWESHRLPDSLPLYDYAPDVRVVGDYVYFSASRRGTICDFYRTKDILNGPFERIPGTFDFWDPNLFLDDDGKLYFYWGCNNVTPIWGVELEPETMVPKTERKELIYGQPEKIGYERVGENHSKMPLSEEEAVEKFKEFLKAQGKDADHLTEEQIGFAKIMFSQRPFIEGAWMTKHDGTYYLQYAGPGTEYNVTVTVFTRVIPRLARSVWQRTIHIPINRADSCAVQATVRRWKTAMETGGIPRQCRSAKPRYGASRRHLAGRLRQRWCPVLQSAVRRLADGGGAGKRRPVGRTGVVSLKLSESNDGIVLGRRQRTVVCDR